MSDPEPNGPGAAPSADGLVLYSQEMAAEICRRIMSGLSLRQICQSDDMPARSTIHAWLAEDAAFADQYARACAVRADEIFDEIFDIADDGQNDWMERKDADGANAGWQENGEALRRSALRIDARKWALSKMQPKKYGDKQTLEHTGPGGAPVVSRIVIEAAGDDSEDQAST